MRVQHSHLSGSLNNDGLFKQYRETTKDLLDLGEYHSEFFS